MKFKKKNQISSTSQVTKSQQQSLIDQVKEFFRSFWIIFIAFGGILVYFFVRNKKTPDTLPDDVRQSGKQFSDDVNVIRQNEQKDLSNEAQVHQEKTEAIKKKYESEKEKLDEETKNKAEKLFEEHKNDPEALAKELSKVTGFRVILPED